MPRPRLLDLYCGAGGCAMGYHRAGFDVVGVDHVPQPRYPFEFVQADALQYAETRGRAFDVIHASPPCQGYSRLRHLPWLKGKQYPLLIAETLRLLEDTGKLWVIENVQDAGAETRTRHTIMLCGTMFVLKVYRHRLFASNVMLFAPDHSPHRQVIGSGRLLNDRATANADGWCSLVGKGTRINGTRSVSDYSHVAGHFVGMDAAKDAMGIDWMNRKELAQAIPPAYTEFVGRQLINVLS